MYAVISFDFNGSSDVTLHALTRDETAARRMFDTLRAQYAERHARAVAKYPDAELTELVDLVHIRDGEFLSESGATLFWGEDSHKSLTRLDTNNK